MARSAAGPKCLQSASALAQLAFAGVLDGRTGRQVLTPPHLRRSPMAQRYEAVRTNSCPSDTATVLRQYGEQSPSSVLLERISNFGPARKTVVTPSSSVVT